MRHDVILPKQGMYEGDVELIEWIAGDRQAVDEGAPLYLLGTDKAEVEVESPARGWLVHTEGDGFEGPIGTVVGYIVTEQEELP